MKKNGIFMITMIALAVIAYIGSFNNKITDKTNNNIYVAENEESSKEETVGIEFTVETIHQETFMSKDETTEALTEATTEVMTEPETEPPTIPPTQPPTQPPTEPVTEPVTEPATEATMAPQPERTFNKYVFVGDSRMVGMKLEAERTGLATPNRIFICEGGEGYNYLNANLATIHGLCDSQTVLVIALGINDMGNVDKYISIYNAMANWDCKIYYTLVNPVNEAKELADRGNCNFTNEKINQFNVRVMQNLDTRIGIIDTYSYVSGLIVDYNATNRDGIHYTAKTYLQIFQYILGFLP